MLTSQNLKYSNVRLNTSVIKENKYKTNWRKNIKLTA